MTVEPLHGGGWPKYPSRSDSGVAWLGAIPEHWRTAPLGSSVRTLGGGTPSKSEPAFWVGDIPWVSPKDMKSYRIDDAEDHISEAAVANSAVSLIPAPAVLMVVRGMILAHTVPVAVTGRPVTINQDMKALLPATSLDPRYLTYQLAGLNAALLGLVEEAGHGTCCLRTEHWRRFRIAVPPLEEQRAIAAFLDRETARIDALIATKEQLLRMLEERRDVETRLLVTRGMSGAPLRDAGLAWVGPVVQDWPILKLGWCFALIGSGTTPKTSVREFYDGGTVPWITSSELRESLILDSATKVTDLALSEHAALKVYPPESLVVAMYGATIGRLGWLGIDACVNQACCVFAHPTLGIDRRFIFYFLRAHRTALVEYLGAGGGQGNISKEKLEQIRLPVPPKDEQARIVDRLIAANRFEESVTVETQRSILLLREQRQALITAAVTGQIDVRALS